MLGYLRALLCPDRPSSINITAYIPLYYDAKSCGQIGKLTINEEATQFAGATVPQLGHLNNRARDKTETVINAAPWSHLIINSHEQNIIYCTEKSIEIGKNCDK